MKGAIKPFVLAGLLLTSTACDRGDVVRSVAAILIEPVIAAQSADAEQQPAEAPQQARADCAEQKRKSRA